MKMAIVSSYSESCGNAAFTKVLHDSIEFFHKEIDVEVIELDLTLLQSINRKVRVKADIHINDICKKLRSCDVVNIQMEAGLYGTLPHDIVRRFNRLVSANEVTSVTLHSPRLISTQSGGRSGIKKLLKLNIKGGIKDLLGDKYRNIHLTVNKKIIKSTINNRARIIVHTLRAQKQIKDFFGFERVTVHPLKLVGADYISNAKTYSDLFDKAGLLDNDILIGMFGYLSAYKGHTDALNALKILPKNYKLLIFGRQHPQSLKSDGEVDSYISRLVNMVRTANELENRVLFMGELNDQDFLDVVSGVDVAWLPYYENGQDGSGIASICLDLSPRVLCSSSFAFDELFKLVSYKNVMRFDIGNILEMALKTKIILGGEAPEKPYGEEHKYSLKTQAEAYVNELTI